MTNTLDNTMFTNAICKALRIPPDNIADVLVQSGADGLCVHVRFVPTTEVLRIYATSLYHEFVLAKPATDKPEQKTLLTAAGLSDFALVDRYGTNCYEIGKREAERPGAFKAVEKLRNDMLLDERELKNRLSQREKRIAFLEEQLNGLGTSPPQGGQAAG